MRVVQTEQRVIEKLRRTSQRYRGKPKELPDIRALFDEIDKDGSGALDAEELCFAHQQLGLEGTKVCWRWCHAVGVLCPRRRCLCRHRRSFLQLRCICCCTQADAEKTIASITNGKKTLSYDGERLSFPSHACTIHRCSCWDRDAAPVMTRPPASCRAEFVVSILTQLEAQENSVHRNYFPPLIKNTPVHRFKRRVWLLLDEPSSSPAASSPRVVATTVAAPKSFAQRSSDVLPGSCATLQARGISMFFVLVIFISTSSFIVDNMPSVRGRYVALFELIETVSVAIFTIEFIGRYAAVVSVCL